MKGFPSLLRHPLLQLLLLVLLMAGGAALAMLEVVLLMRPVFGVKLDQLAVVSQNPGAFPAGWGFLMFYQATVMLGALAGAALVLARLSGQSVRAYFSPRRLGAGWWLLGAAALIVCVLPFMSGLVSWNAGAHFPAALHGFETWAHAKEDQAAVLTKYLTQFSSAGRFLVGLLVIALVPAVAEELVFRGVIQQNLIRLFGSVHAGVWLGAAIFSAIHFQFFGFVPRFVLGLVLGYLYAWSGNILVSMAAHFTQNALQLVLLYLAQRGAFGWGFDPDSTDALPWPLVIVSAVGTAALLWFLHQRMAPAGPRLMRTVSSRGVVAGPGALPAQ